MKQLLILTAPLLAPLAVRAATPLELPALFGDQMVLQRERAVPVWGWAEPGEQVTVEFAGQTKTTTGDVNGKWLVKLEAMPASAEARTLKVNSLMIADVLVGEVWLASGQSNMGYTLSPQFDAALAWALQMPKATDADSRFRCFMALGNGWIAEVKKSGGSLDGSELFAKIASADDRLAAVIGAATKGTDLPTAAAWIKKLTASHFLQEG